MISLTHVIIIQAVSIFFLVFLIFYINNNTYKDINEIRTEIKKILEQR